LMLIGDTAQLPPIGENESKALNAEYLQGFGLDTFEIELNEVVRQRAESGILLQATHIRQYITAIQKQMYEYGQTEEIKQPLIPAKPFPDLQCVEGEELLEALEDSYSQVGIEDTIIITRANWRANQYNMGIRNRILWREELLERGDLLMVAKNNYYWAEQDKRDDFLANGEIIQVRKVIKRYKLYGFEWAQVELEVPDHEEWYPEVLLLVDTLLAEAPALTKEQQEKLYYAILEDYQHITTQKARLNALKEDKHFNALQVKYAYAITCHKSQGGQWRRVFLDGAMLQEDMLNLDGLRWLYTAYTRATDKLYLINYPERGKEAVPIRSNEENV
nr:ATP-dependent helicase [Bacteroidaceae bacterium]